MSYLFGQEVFGKVDIGELGQSVEWSGQDMKLVPVEVELRHGLLLDVQSPKRYRRIVLGQQWAPEKSQRATAANGLGQTSPSRESPTDSSTDLQHTQPVDNSKIKPSDHLL